MFKEGVLRGLKLLEPRHGRDEQLPLTVSNGKRAST
jgi:hypothetical protein